MSIYLIPDITTPESNTKELTISTRIMSEAVNKNNPTPSFHILRWAALLEGTSLIALLFIAMPLKYWANIPLGVKIVGPAHGFLFLAFIGVLLFHFLKRDLSLVKTLVGIVASFVPFGTFVFKARML